MLFTLLVKSRIRFGTDFAMGVYQTLLVVIAVALKQMSFIHTSPGTTRLCNRRKAMDVLQPRLCKPAAAAGRDVREFISLANVPTMLKSNELSA